MTAIQRLSSMYARKLPDRDLATDLLAYVTWGYVVARPDIIVLGRPVCSGAWHADILDPRAQFENPDAWFVLAAAVSDGRSLRDILACMPFRLPRAIFWRAGRGPWQREYDISKLEAKI